MTEFAIGKDFVLIRFQDQMLYLYDEEKPGRVHVDKMKSLAAKGSGLATYINQHVRQNFQRKLD